MKRRLKNYLVPHEENDHKPHIFREASVLLLAIVILGSFTLSAYEANLLKNDKGFLAAVLPSVLVSMTNDDRTDRGVDPLAYSAVLERAAQMKANDMARQSYFAHTSPKGVTPWHWFREAGYDFAYAGENLAVDFEESAEVDEAWMHSPHHRRNILDRQFTEIGIATARGMYQGEEVVYVVQLFGKPQEDSLAGNEQANRLAMNIPSGANRGEYESTNTNEDANRLERRSKPSDGNSAPAPGSSVESETSQVAGTRISNTEGGTSQEAADPISSPSMKEYPRSDGGQTLNNEGSPEWKFATTSALAGLENSGDSGATALGAPLPQGLASPNPKALGSPVPTDLVPASSLAEMAGSTSVTPKTTILAWVILHQVMLLQMLYLILGMLIAFSLALMIRFEVHHHHLKHATAGAGLLVLMVALTTLTHFYLFPVLSFS